MAGLVPAIHVLFVAQKTWMPGTSPGMTELSLLQNSRTLQVKSRRYSGMISGLLLGNFAIVATSMLRCWATNSGGV